MQKNSVYSALNVHHDSDTHHHIRGSGVVRQDETGDCKEDIGRSTFTGITGGMRSCPTATMEAILDRTPLHLVLEAAAQDAHLGRGKGAQ